MLPLLLAAGALKIGGDLLGASAQNKAAKQNRRAAIADQAQELNTLSLRGMQESQASTTAKQDAALKIQQDHASASLAAAENGVMGNSVDALHSELENQRGMYNDSIAENLSNMLTQLNKERAGVVARTQSRINSVQPANPFATGLKLAGDALSTFSQFSAQAQALGGGNPSGSIGRVPAMRLTPTREPLRLPMQPVNLRING